MAILVEACLESWDALFTSQFGKHGIKIGEDIFPRPQTVSLLLHELIPRELAERFPGHWRPDESTDEKDAVYIPDPSYSFEIKCSTAKKRIYGNRSYAQESTREKKAKSGYYLAINFENLAKPQGERAEIRLIRFGWLDSNDWIGQKSPTGQQSRLPIEVEAGKLLPIYDWSEKGQLL
jgi:hypothetical protein